VRSADQTNNPVAPHLGYAASSGVEDVSFTQGAANDPTPAGGTAPFDQFSGNISYGAQGRAMKAGQNQGIFSPFNTTTPSGLLTQEELQRAADGWQQDYSHSQFQPCFQTQSYGTRYEAPREAYGERTYGRGQPIEPTWVR